MDFDIVDIQERILINDINYRLALREVGINKKMLENNLDEKQRQLLDLIIEHKDFVKSIVAKTSFEEGFKLGVKLLNEINRQLPSEKNTK